MIQLIAAPGTPADAVLRAHRLADPDSLLEMAECFRDSGSWSADLSDRFSLVLHDLRMGGTWKRTRRGRLTQSEAMLAKHLHPRFRTEVTLLDLGASDGITTLDAVQTLRRMFGGCVRAFLTDLNLWLLRYRKAGLIEYRATNGEPIMVRLGRFGLRLAGHRRDMTGNLDPIARAYLQRKRFRSSMHLESRISLVNPLVQIESGITVMELDCFTCSDTLIGKISAARASNVLNIGYFVPEQIAQAVSNIYKYLKPSGCLVVSRNRDDLSGEVENGSVWVKDEGRFVWLQDFGSGSEVKDLVSGWRSN